MQTPGLSLPGTFSVALSGPSLADRFDPRRNSLAVMRLGLAATVAVVHAQAIGWGDQPAIGSTALGDLAVDAFFVISGFLVTRSATRLPSLRRFAWHRALRILPGFWACLLVVALVGAPVMARLQGRAPQTVLTGDQSSIDYLRRNLGLLIRQWDIAGLASSTTDRSVNGSLWTLFYEAACYAAVAVLVAVGVLHSRRDARPGAGRRRLVEGPAVLGLVRRHGVLVLTVLVWAAETAQAAGWVHVGPDVFVRFLLVFLLGALAHVYAGRLRFSPALLLGAGATFTLSLLATANYRPVGAGAFAYLLVWAVVGLPLSWTPGVDLSYGVYVYHWPVLQVLEHGQVAQGDRAVFTAVGLALTAVIALVSWRLVEAPALRLKGARWVDGVGSARA